MPSQMKCEPLGWLQTLTHYRLSLVTQHICELVSQLSGNIFFDNLVHLKLKKCFWSLFTYGP
jgi:hypothetical protein